MKSDKIKVWARIGEIAFWLSKFFYTGWTMQYEPFESAGTTALILDCTWVVFALIFSEAIVRLIGYFAELIEKQSK